MIVPWLDVMMVLDRHPLDQVNSAGLHKIVEDGGFAPFDVQLQQVNGIIDESRETSLRDRDLSFGQPLTEHAHGERSRILRIDKEIHRSFRVAER